MGRKIKKIIKSPFLLILDYLRFILDSAAENHLRMEGRYGLRKKFSSYSQLKRYQSKLRRFLFLVMLFAFGMLASQIFLPELIRTEVFIPENEGEITISSIEDDGATLVFKTLDAANFNKPLATTAQVSVYEDQNLQNLIKVTDPDDYAVTHMIKISGLENDKDYFLKITAADASSNGNIKKAKDLPYVAGKEVYLKFHTGEEFIAANSCEEKLAIEVAKYKTIVNEATNYQETINPGANIPGKFEGADYAVSGTDETGSGKKADVLAIDNILHENALYGADKVQTIISWRTNKKASTVVIYREGKGGEEKELSIGSKIDFSHMAVFTSFKPGTVYYLKVKSADETGGIAISKEFSFLTPQKNESVTRVIVNNIKQVFKQIIPDK